MATRKVLRGMTEEVWRARRKGIGVPGAYEAARVLLQGWEA